MRWEGKEWERHQEKIRKGMKKNIGKVKSSKGKDVSTMKGKDEKDNKRKGKMSEERKGTDIKQEKVS